MEHTADNRKNTTRSFLRKAARAFAVLIGFCLVCDTAACGGTQPDTEKAVSEADAAKEGQEADKKAQVTTEEGKRATQEEKETAEEPETTTEERETEPQAETADAAVKQVRDTEYETLIAGGLSKEELEFVLAYGPQEIPEQGFPAGVYFSADPSGGSFRGSLTVDPAGVAVYMEWSGGTGEGYETIYQMAADSAASVSDGVTAYVLQFREENEFRLTDDGREVTAHSESGEDRILYYNAGQKTLQEEDGFLWAPEE